MIVDIRWLVLPREKCLTGNALVFRSEAVFKVIGVSLVFVSWLSPRALLQ